MIVKIFSIFDKKALAYLQPFFFHNKGEALRAFDDLITSGQSPVSKHPADYQLFMLGGWDDQTGAIISLPKPEFLEEAENIKKPEAKNNA